MRPKPHRLASFRVFVLTAAFFFIPSIAVRAQQPPANSNRASTVTVSATGQVSVPPDTAVVNWLITGQAPQLKAAYADAQRQAAAVRDLLQAQGFTPAEAQWSAYAIQPNIDYKTHRVSSYTVSVGLELKLSNFTKIGPLLDAAGSAGLTSLRSVSFQLKDQGPARARAIADAYRQVDAEAAAFAQAAGRRLQGLAQATVDVGGPISPMPIRPMMSAMMASAAPPTAEFTPQSVTVTARVTAGFRLAP